MGQSSITYVCLTTEHKVEKIWKKSGFFTHKKLLMDRVENIRSLLNSREKVLGKSPTSQASVLQANLDLRNCYSSKLT